DGDGEGEGAEGDRPPRRDGAALAQQLLDAGADPNLHNREGFTPVHLCVLARNSSVLQLLLGAGADGGRGRGPKADVNARTAEGHPPLWFALLAEGAGAEAEGAYPSDCAAERLLAAGAAPNPAYPPPAQPAGDRLLHRLARDALEPAALFVAARAPPADLAAANANGETALHVACAKGLARLATRLLERGVPPNAQTLRPPSTPYTPPTAPAFTPAYVPAASPASSAASAASAASTVSVGRSPFDDDDDDEDEDQGRVGGADVNVVDGRGLSLLHRALLAGDAAAALFLLESGADPHLPAPAAPPASPRAATPLQLALRARLPAVCEALCRRGADLSADLSAGDDPPLWEALADGQADVAAALVRHGADPDCWAPGPDGCLQTLLHRALDENNEPVAKFLIRSGCDLNSPRRAGPAGASEGAAGAERAGPLHLCCQWGLEEAARTLVEHGADVNQRDADGRTPLHAAVRAHHAAIISLLLCHPGLDLAVRDRAGLTPFATALTVRNPRAAQAILDRLPSAAEQVDGKGRNFLHTAIVRGDVESVLFLLALQVDVNSRVQDAEQTPPLLLAAAEGDEMLVRSLILAGARVNDADARRRTALHVAAAAGHAHVVSALLQNGADTRSSRPTDGNTALLLAYMKGNGNLCRTLVKAGACLGCMNKDGITIFNYQVATKQLLYRLLDHLSQEPPWAEGDICLECGTKFGLTMRKHHCRHCGRILCSKCSGRDVPILKFNLNKPVRVCAVCFDVLQYTRLLLSVYEKIVENAKVGFKLLLLLIFLNRIELSVFYICIIIILEID
ncbi:LOW QUALITY PROTEIN: Poly [ADP-ribose] polymerase tankyrase, partial [Gryllus bimaculatus]